ncbi:MAG: ankyrin repeat domain-containing protein [Xanthomonadaceae bacterium]|nr:ankyrin repeat domain-containing protein [Xanthomonadaceae bacterium]
MPNTPLVIDEELLALAQQVFDLARNGDAETLATLLAHGLPANMCNDRGDSLQMLAAYHGHAETCRLLLVHGADPELRNDRGQTPLAGAAFKGDVDVVRVLLAHGAEVDGRCSDGRTPLMYAAMFDRTDIVALLLEHGARAELSDRMGIDALSLARAMGATKAVQQLDAPRRH